MTDPQLLPGRRMYEQAARERFGASLWWVTPRPDLDDSPFMQGIRRRALSEALDGIEDESEVA